MTTTLCVLTLADATHCEQPTFHELVELRVEPNRPPEVLRADTFCVLSRTQQHRSKQTVTEKEK